MNIRRGDIFFIKNNKPVTGCEMGGSRPAIIVSNDHANTFSENVTVVWLTSQQKKPLPTHCMVKVQTLSTALCESINTISKDRIGGYMRSLTEKEMEEVDRCLSIAHGLLEQKTSEVEVAEPYVYEESNDDDFRDTFEELIHNIDDCYFEEKNEMKAEGIDIALREVRKMYRRVLAEGV